MRQQGFVSLILIVIIAAVAIGAYYLGFNQNNAESVTNTPPTSSPISAEPSPLNNANVPSGWLTYKNQEYGFEISYPKSYKALTDSENLYGWPEGVVLLYNGGQVYDIAVEVWNNESEYKSKYSGDFDVKVKQVNGKILTILNSSEEEENIKIISTFRATN